MHYTDSELEDAAFQDLLRDAESAEDQAANGPFYLERGITAASLRAYAASCREKIERNRGALHKAALRP